MAAPRPTDPRPADPRAPGPRRKARAGFLIAALVAVIAAVTFVGMNIEHARELEESPPPPPSPTTVPGIAPETAPQPNPPQPNPG